MNKAKKFISVMLCALGILMLAGCSWSSGDGHMPNPFIDCSDMKAAAKISGFEMTAPETANGYAKSKIQAIQDEMVQVIYGTDDSNVYLRKVAKKAITGKDALTTVTGDYNKYAYTGTVTVGKTQIKVKGDSAEKIAAAVWSDSNYYYAVTAGGCTLTPSTIETLAKAVK